jgi:SAM-dependent methyltransferase
MTDRDEHRLESDYYEFMDFDPENNRASVSFYVEMFSEAAPVIELAPGRGEFLSLLTEAGIAGRGVDIDEGMVSRARAAGADVALGDAVEFLHTLPSASVGGVFAAHFLEHLEPAAVERVVAGAAHAVRPGGTVVFAVPSAACFAVLGHDFWADPTHVRFYDPRLISFFLTRAGFEIVDSGGNPHNVGGPFPGTTVTPAEVDPPLDDVITDSMRALRDPRRKAWEDPDNVWATTGHLLTTLAQRLKRTQEQLVETQRGYAKLLDTLFGPNEVYVRARAR